MYRYNRFWCRGSYTFLLRRIGCIAITRYGVGMMIRRLMNWTFYTHVPTWRFGLYESPIHIRSCPSRVRLPSDRRRAQGSWAWRVQVLDSISLYPTRFYLFLLASVRQRKALALLILAKLPVLVSECTISLSQTPLKSSSVVLWKADTNAMGISSTTQKVK